MSSRNDLECVLEASERVQKVSKINNILLNLGHGYEEYPRSLSVLSDTCPTLPQLSVVEEQSARRGTKDAMCTRRKAQPRRYASLQ